MVRWWCCRQETFRRSSLLLLSFSATINICRDHILRGFLHYSRVLPCLTKGTTQAGSLYLFHYPVLFRFRESILTAAFWPLCSSKIVRWTAFKRTSVLNVHKSKTIRVFIFSLRLLMVTVFLKLTILLNTCCHCGICLAILFSGDEFCLMISLSKKSAISCLLSVSLLVGSFRVLFVHFCSSLVFEWLFHSTILVGSSNQFVFLLAVFTHCSLSVLLCLV